MTVRSLGAAVLALAMLLASAPTAHAGTLFGGPIKILEIAVTSTNHATIKFSQNITSKASCATVTNHMAFDISTSKGRGLLSVATSAMLANLTVAAFGTQTGTTATCTDITFSSGGAVTKYETLYHLAIAP